ncbi:MAG: glycosyltransferase family 4 protein [Armatimonadota bacterium]|nr:glycosyltransferase family 4 protein [bacterium]
MKLAEEKNTDMHSAFRRLRICMVAPYLPRRGGVTIQAHMMMDGLISEGAKVVCVDTILHSLSSRFLLPLRMLLQPLFTAVRFLKSAPSCDIVHIHASSMWGFLPVFVCAPLNKWLIKKRMIISFHGARGHLWVCRYASFTVPFLRMADTVVVVSPLLKTAFEKVGLSSEVLWNLVNLDRFHYRERKSIKPNIVWIRHFIDMCDPLTALKAFAEIREQIPEATITLIGDGELKPALDRFIKEKRIEGVRFTGRLPNEQVPFEFGKADIFLNSSNSDGFPTCLLEASASGLPIVTTDAGGIQDMIENNVNGLIVPVGDYHSLAENVVSLIRNPKRACVMGKAARENAEKYNWPRCAHHLAMLYGIENVNA